MNVSFILASKHPGLVLWYPDAGKDWRQEEKGTTEDEMVGWHHWLSGREFEQALGDCGGQPGVLQSMGWQRVRHDWVTELNWKWGWRLNLQSFTSSAHMTQCCCVWDERAVTVTWTVCLVGCGQTKNASSVPSFVVMKTFCNPESLVYSSPW